jgi:hypothetical protein
MQNEDEDDDSNFADDPEFFDQMFTESINMD